MNASGFTHRIPVSEQAFVGGLECQYGDAPLGYYRYHYWINSDTPKSHENYIFVGKNVGCICISLIQEKESGFRILFRSSFVKWWNLINLISYIYFLGLENALTRCSNIWDWQKVKFENCSLKRSHANYMRWAFS